MRKRRECRNRHSAHSTHGDEPVVLDPSDKLASIRENYGSQAPIPPVRLIGSLVSGWRSMRLCRAVMRKYLMKPIPVVTLIRGAFQVADDIYLYSGLPANQL